MSVKVSVIVPVYNVEKYLAQCLDSIVKQTFQDIEIVLVNDGSQDSSEKICQQYKSKYPDMIRFYSQVNKGLAETRNFALEQAQGEYVAFVDSDDYIGEDFIKELYDVAEKKDSDMIICNYTKVDEQGKNECTYSANYEDDTLRIPSYISCNRLVRKTLFDIYKIKYKKGIIFEDIPVMLKLEAIAKNVQIITMADYYYRTNPQSITNTFKKKKYTVEQLPFEAMKETIEFCMDKKHCLDYKKLEFFVCRIWTSLLFDVGRGSKKDVQKIMSREVKAFMNEYFPQCYHNPYIKLRALKKLPKYQKIGTWLFVHAYHINVLYGLMRICSIL